MNETSMAVVDGVGGHLPSARPTLKVAAPVPDEGETMTHGSRGVATHLTSPAIDCASVTVCGGVATRNDKAAKSTTTRKLSFDVDNVITGNAGAMVELNRILPVSGGLDEDSQCCSKSAANAATSPPASRVNSSRYGEAAGQQVACSAVAPDVQPCVVVRAVARTAVLPGVSSAPTGARDSRNENERPADAVLEL